MVRHNRQPLLATIATFRGMRKSLMSSFDQIYVLDLHGSTNPKEVTPAGKKNENVFDIQKGVAIILLVKKPGSQKGIWHADFGGSRQEKYVMVAEKCIGSVVWAELAPQGPYWLFNQSKAAAQTTTELSAWFMRNIFAPSGDPAPGFVTTHDQFAISFTPTEADRKINLLLESQDEEDARRYFRLCSQDQ